MRKLTAVAVISTNDTDFEYFQNAARCPIGAYLTYS